MTMIKVYGTEMCHDTQRSRALLDELKVEYAFHNIDNDEDAERKVIEWGSGKRKIPVIDLGGERLTEPSNGELEQALERRKAA